VDIKKRECTLRDFVSLNALFLVSEEGVSSLRAGGTQSETAHFCIPHLVCHVVGGGGAQCHCFGVVVRSITVFLFKAAKTPRIFVPNVCDSLCLKLE